MSGGPLTAPMAALDQNMKPWGRIGRRNSLRLSAGVLLALVFCALLAPAIVALTGAPAPGFRDTQSLSSLFGSPAGPSSEHWFGVDQLGRDVFSRTLYGARVSLVVAVASTTLTMFLGVTLGLVAGYRGGWIDTVVSRLLETVLVIPYLMLAIGIASACSTEEGCVGGTLRPGIPLVVLVISITSWPVVARIVRNQTLVLRDSEFVLAARLAGASKARILRTEILPNLMAPIAVFAVVLIPQTILAEAALSFLGAGVPTSTASWGGMIAEATPLFPESWWYMLFPGLALTTTVFASTVLADALRDRPSSTVSVTRRGDAT